ncbi:CPBP family intramembrane metalloprotease [Paenibacillus tritici]|nr:CPBP family intramembrane metalloprotease [Paenibacillus tritici]QUL56464.1 CPBP family intramembrane metalloprotease [Paenibacillus tritici]
MFGVFLLLFILNFGIHSDNPMPTARMWLLLGVWAFLISLVLLIKNKLPLKRQILISLLLALAVAAAYINLSLFSMIEVSIITLFASLAVFSTFNRYNSLKLVFLNTASKKSVAVSLLTGIAVGVLLGIINLMLSGSSLDGYSIRLAYFKVALSPAIYEEIALRALFYALCLSMLHGKIETRAQKFTVWFMMIIPHVLVHTPDSFINGGIIPGIVTILMYVILFGLPFAVLQRKRDLTSAMLAHGIVDVIRFCFMGLPY